MCCPCQLFKLTANGFYGKSINVIKKMTSSVFIFEFVKNIVNPVVCEIKPIWYLAD